jgi:Uma2 family endonuclease
MSLIAVSAMATIDDPAVPSLERPPFPVHRFTVAEYQRMGELGILSEDDRVELLEGWIVPKMYRNPPHDGTIEIIQQWLLRTLPAGWCCRIQSALVTSDSQPEPDLTIVRGDPIERLRRHPGPEDVGLIIEVADTTLESDRIEKSRIYARAKIAIYWIVNLIDQQIEVRTEPTGPRRRPVFRHERIHQRDDPIQLILDGKVVASPLVAEFFP